MLSSLWKNYIQIFGNTQICRIITHVCTFTVLILTMFAFVMSIAIFVFDHDPWEQGCRRVHPDEIEVRDWIYSVNGTMESRYVPERHIRRVRLSNCNITDDDLLCLTQLTWLQDLDLSYTSITDDAVPTIISISTLRDLNITGTRITPKGIWRIVTERTDLNLTTDKWEQIKDVAHPDEIEIRDWITSVQGSVKYQYVPNRNIIEVDLSNCNITDNDLICLKKLSHLKGLEISNTDISDEAVPTIISISSLKYLDISNTRITEEGVRQIMSERPDLY